MTKENSIYSTVYDERVVLFLDILGFGELVSVSSKEIDKIVKIQQAIQTIRNVFEITQTTHERTVTQFSDSIVVSFLITEKGEVAFLLSKIQKLLKSLIPLGIICRGAITKGEMIHDKEFMFGPAFIEAFKLETKSAFYPRVILIDESIIEIGVKYYGYHPADDEEFEKSEIKSTLSKDFDGFYYVNYINEETMQEISKEGKEYVSQLADFISTRLKNYEDNPNVSQKYEWMREKYNALVRELKKDTKIKVEKMWFCSDKSDVFYTSLSEI